jgi:hypothetical protein
MEKQGLCLWTFTKHIFLGYGHILTGLENQNTAMGIRHTDHVAHSIRKS